MKVRELIDHLAQFPGDAEVVYDRYSDCEVLNAEDVTLMPAAAKEVVFRGGRYCRDYSHGQWPPGEAPQHVTVVHFPGN